MGDSREIRRLVLVSRKRNDPRAQAVVRWARALLPAMALVLAPLDAKEIDYADDGDAVVLDVDQVSASPLSLADAVARATRESRSSGAPSGDVVPGSRN